jgi:hypothetical protein
MPLTSVPLQQAGGFCPLHSLVDCSALDAAFGSESQTFMGAGRAVSSLQLIWVLLSGLVCRSTSLFGRIEA